MEPSHVRTAVRAAAVLALAGFACSDSTAPKPVALQILAPPSATAVATFPLATQPVIQAVDASGNAMAVAGVEVKADIQGTGAFVLSGGTVTTDATGAAVFETLTLGSTGEGGVVALRFSATGVAPVATNIDLSCEVKSLFLGIAVTSALVSGDCIRQSGSTIGSAFHYYDLDVPAGIKALRVTDTSTAFPPVVVLRGPNEPVRFLGQGAPIGGTGISFRVLVPTGVQRVLATSRDAEILGSYKIKIEAAPESDDTCDELHFQSPLSTTQTLRAECTDATATLFPAGTAFKVFVFIMSPNASISTTATSSAFTPLVELWRQLGDGSIAFETSVTGTGTTATVNFTNATTAPQIYVLFVTSSDGAGIGDFTLQGTITNPATSLVRGATPLLMYQDVVAPRARRRFPRNPR